jgi:hypothetical protein
LVACGGDRRDHADAGTGSFASLGSSDSVGDSESSAGTGGVTEGGEPFFDVGGGGGTGQGEGGDEKGCEKIDFLFVIDNSMSMGDEQQQLVDSFPGFIDTIRDTLMAQDYQILVTATDDLGNVGAGTGSCNSACQGQGCCAQECSARPHCTCNWGSCVNLSPCQKTLGAGRLHDSKFQECGVEGANRYIVDGQPDVYGAFACMGLVGTYGSGSERPMQAVLDATGPLSEPGECNAGFLRDDAILVVTYITDEHDVDSPGNPAAWKQQLVGHKGGNESAIVVLGLVGDYGKQGSACTEYDPINGNGAENAVELQTFAESFERGSWGSVCAHDYAPFFADAVAEVDAACDDFVPEG